MKIRSVTSFINVASNGQVSKDDSRILEQFHQSVSNHIDQSDYEVQSLRCATNPFPEYLNCEVDNSIKTVKALEKQTQSIGFDYLSIGTAFVHDLAYYDLISPILRETENVFATAHMAAMEEPLISVDAIKAVARIIKQLSNHDENGFGNLYFAALAKVPGGIPFLPSAYNKERKNGVSFALAMESADLAVESFSEADSLVEAGIAYKNKIEYHAQRLESLFDSYIQDIDIEFLGFDFTPAPFVSFTASAGNALENLFGQSLGEMGSVSAAAYLMSYLDSAEFKRSGFNGLMLPVLEDSILAERVSNGSLSIKDLLLYSTVCGTGLDTVPLPGDITEVQLQAILFDVASLAVRLNKPLTARLMPIPGKKAGDKTSFDFPFFTNSAVMSPEGSGLSGLFSEGSSYFLKPRQ